MYNRPPISKWPPSPGREFISLAIVKGQSCRDEYIGHILRGNVKQVLLNKKEIFIEEVFDPVGHQKLVLIEGAPGIGKSTLAWELCRKWEEFSCMQQFSLVVLLRLREEIVQQISEISQLFISYESKHKKALVDEVSENQGDNILFILDGFDELPKTLQKKSFLLDLIKGHVLPASTILVTSRPSATAEQLSSCHPKHIEILGFTQESVEAYASSIFSSEPEELKKFMSYISASENPAINSLMYIPLNAAIIVQIYLDCKSDAFLPHTLTELYTLLCLTILNRDLKIRVEKLEDLPADCHKQFLHLSRIAFDGILNEEVIFHSLSPGLVHFGFLNAVSALYGGGRVSHNFLHLTLQEFFAAYHISHLGSSGLEVFKQHGNDKRWNVVWRFVAGLTQFKHYKGHMDSDSMFYFQCLFEAQSINSFSLILPHDIIKLTSFDSSTAFDAYALGFCISNFHFENSLNLSIFNNHWTAFANGLKRKKTCDNIPSVCRIHVAHCPIAAEELKVLELLSNLTCLIFHSCELNDIGLIRLSNAIPHMKNLSELHITNKVSHQGQDGLLKLLYQGQDGLLKLLQQLSHSKVTSLNLVGTDRYNSPHIYSSALRKLLDPSSGSLHSLHVSDERLASIVSASSSLKYLELYKTNLSEHVSYLKNNRNLTKLRLAHSSKISEQSSDIVEIVKCNTTVLDLELLRFNIHDDADFAAVRTIVSALSGNNTLQSITISLYSTDIGGIPVHSYMLTHHQELTLDSRIKYGIDNISLYGYSE